MKWLLVITWLVGAGTPATVIQFEDETLCSQARDRVTRPQPDNEPDVSKRRRIAFAVCLQVARWRRARIVTVARAGGSAWPSPSAPAFITSSTGVRRPATGCATLPTPSRWSARLYAWAPGAAARRDYEEHRADISILVGCGKPQIPSWTFHARPSARSQALSNDRAIEWHPQPSRTAALLAYSACA